MKNIQENTYLTQKIIARRDKYRISNLYIDDVYFCDVLEDTDRGLKQSMSSEEISKKKIKGQTAIPTGTYEVVITYSNRFKKQLPLLLNVKGFSGIRIHSGNTHKDTEGCLLVGVNKVVGKVLNSRETFNKLFKVLKERSSKGKIYITIK